VSDLRAIVLLSGGLDSATALAIANRDGYECWPLSFDYGQTHAVELQAAARIATRAGDGSRHYVQRIEHPGDSALTGDHVVPMDREVDAMSDGIPVTYVPARNTILLAFAVAHAEVREADAIYCGVNALDYSGYPDCRPEYVRAFETMANLATKRAVEGQHLRICTPLIDKTKAEIIRVGTALRVPYELTHSCYAPDAQGDACGRCDSCILRAKGFKEAGVPDPSRYTSAWTP